MRRPQFRLSTLLWITLAVACWFGGRAVERREIEQSAAQREEELFRHVMRRQADDNERRRSKKEQDLRDKGSLRGGFDP
jgi:hypothetical protein